MHPFWFALGLAILTIMTFRSVLTHHRRTQALRKLAHARRLSFSPEDLIGIHERYNDLALIRQGHNRHVWNLLYGSIESGLVSLFCYRYDLGLDVGLTQRQWWIAVVEMPGCLAGWRARPVNRETGTGCLHARHEDGLTLTIAGFDVEADARDTLEPCRRAGIEAILREASPTDQLETHAHFIAVATPLDDDPATPARVLDLAARLAGAISATGRSSPRPAT